MTETPPAIDISSLRILFRPLSAIQSVVPWRATEGRTTDSAFPLLGSKSVASMSREEYESLDSKPHTMRSVDFDELTAISRPSNNSSHFVLNNSIVSSHRKEQTMRSYFNSHQGNRFVLVADIDNEQGSFNKVVPCTLIT